MNSPNPMVLAAAASLAVFIAALVAFQAFLAVKEWRLRKKALGSLNRDHEGEDDTAQAPSLFLRARGMGEEGLLRIMAERIPQLWDLQHLLMQSGLEWTLRSLLWRIAGFGLGLAFLTWLVTGTAIFAGVALVIGGVGPYLYVRRKKRKRLLKLESQLPDSIDSLARAARAGHPLSEGMRMASEEAPEPLASEFRVMVEELRFGIPFEDALMSFGDRLEIMDVRILITAILVQKEVGGNLTEILEQIAETMRARFTLRRQVRVYTAQGRMSGYTLAALPIFVGLMISLINPPYLSTLFVDPIGQVMLAGAVMLQGIGFLWIRKIVDVRY